MIEYDYVKTKRSAVKAFPSGKEKHIKKFIKIMTKLNVWVFKKTNGRLMKNFPGGYPICIVGSKGKKTGSRREIALIHLPKDDKLLLVASQGGMDTNPVWYYNIAANPNIDVMIGGVETKMIARQVSDDEKRVLWPHLLSLYPDFDEYQARTDRNIPVFECTKVEN
jgi:deazaflavin-dependent oxidoreductase (nitroreductase family)